MSETETETEYEAALKMASGQLHEAMSELGK